MADEGKQRLGMADRCDLLFTWGYLEAQEKHPDVAFVKVNTEDEALKGVSKEHVKVLPTFKFFKARPSLYHPSPCN